jgi:hypothetical protein
MLPVILGAVALGTVGYGIKKCLDDREKCADKFTDVVMDTIETVDNFGEELEKKIDNTAALFGIDMDETSYYTSNEATTTSENINITQFENTKNSAIRSISIFNTVISSIQNIDMKSIKIPQNQQRELLEEDQEQYQILTKEYNTILESLLKDFIMNIHQIHPDIDYNQIDKNQKQIISNAFVLAEGISNILDTKLINKKGKVSKKAKIKLEEFNKLLEIGLE